MKPRASSFKRSPKDRRVYAESMLQKAVVGWLLLSGVPRMFFFSVPNEGERSAATGALLKAMGMHPGVADLVIIMPGGKAHFLELKAKGQKRSAVQIAFAADCDIAGCPYGVADTIEDAIAFLNQWKAIDVHFEGRWGHAYMRKRMKAVGI